MKDTSKLLGNESLRSARARNESDELSSALSIDSKEINWPNRKKMEKLKKQRCKTNCYHILWVFLGLFLFFGAIQILWAPTYLENIVHDGITDAFIFTSPKPNDENYQKWVSNDQGADSIPINVFLQFFNVTNPEDLSDSSLPPEQRIPIFNLTPPIVYKQFYYRENISFSDDGTMARSYFKTRFYHDPELSEISEQDNYTIIAPLVSGGIHWKNIDLFGPYIDQAMEFIPPALSGIVTKQQISDVMYKGFFEWLDDPDNLFTTANARDLIFDILNFEFPGPDGLTLYFNVDLPIVGNTTIPWEIIEPDSNISIIDFTYGMLKNGSGSWYVSHTGLDDEHRMGEVLKWSNQDQNFVSENGTRLINFDDGNFTYIDCWYPHLPYSPSHFIYQGVWRVKEDVNDLPPFFVSTLKKPLIFDYYKSVEYRNIPAEQYNTSTGRQLMNESQYPPNAQFYQFGTSGVLNMTKCFNNLPLYFSLPHFHGAPDFAVNNTKLGMRPADPVLDNGFLQVEPMTGAILNAEVALQGNVPIDPLPEYDGNSTDGTANYSDDSLIHLPIGIMAPTYLLTYKAQLPEAGAEDLAKQINFANNLDEGFYIFGYICIGLGVLYFGFTMYWLGKNGYKKLFPGFCCNDNLQDQIRDASAF